MSGLLTNFFSVLMSVFILVLVTLYVFVSGHKNLVEHGGATIQCNDSLGCISQTVDILALCLHDTG